MVNTAKCKILQHMARITTKQGHNHYTAKAWSLQHKVTITTVNGRSLKIFDPGIMHGSQWTFLKITKLRNTFGDFPHYLDANMDLNFRYYLTIGLQLTINFSFFLICTYFRHSQTCRKFESFRGHNLDFQKLPQKCVTCESLIFRNTDLFAT